MSSEHDTKNSYIMPAESGAEMARLINLDMAVTEAMGDLFPAGLDPTNVHGILDVACGPGGWARGVATQLPDTEVVGIDVSQTMVDYANAYVKVQQLDNIYFLVMDATKTLDFPDASFDLVHARFMAGFLRKEWWTLVVKEFARVTRPGGFIVLTECDTSGDTNSKHFEAVKTRVIQTMARAGLSQNPLGLHFGATPLLAQHLRDAGCHDIRQQPHLLDFSTGAPAHQAMFENMRAGMKLAQPFFLKMSEATQEELDREYEATLLEMMQPDFRGIWYFLTAWGIKS
jgi:ubiquinone/menaquinone biosynthesis C-methylase UbiE